MFRNLTMFRFPPSCADALAGLAHTLEVEPTLMLREPGPMDLATRGFVPVISDDVVMHVGQYLLFAIGTRERLLPASVVNRALQERLTKITETEGRRVGSKERKRLREEVITDLMPRAFIEHRFTRAYVDIAAGWLVIDTASRRIADDVVAQIREALGRFPAQPMAPQESPRAILTDWLVSDQPLPDGFGLGSECELRDPAEGGGKWSGRRVDLEGDDVREHLGAGMQAFALGLEFDDRIGFVLTEDLALRKFQTFDVVFEQHDMVQHESANAELQARLALLAGEVGNLQTRLSSIFGLSRPEDRA